MTDSRPLTPGEVEISRSIFGDAIDLAQVRLVRRKWWPFQPRGVVMAPMGHIHFHPEGRAWSEDFSREPLGAQGLFIHEMTHVWQCQQGGRYYLLLARHPFCRYRYHLRPDLPFSGYGIEQQAEIVRHRFLADRGRVMQQDPPPRDILPF
ncbi:vgr related protein [Sphingomicrobium lutaoense]|uniref:Vgr related protein n=1 Tax=Sphingomicrobium lutaoense TaxID=515949 RepID=A0A839YZX1_9SPHN|nr:vgr related protein [Sphingomicrobium lutaoense]MBB3764000.1 hypothetical protein [Sphingomicrobium lutaoense]